MTGPRAIAVWMVAACASRFRVGMEKLRSDGWIPDTVISHSGWGCGLHVSWVFRKHVVWLPGVVVSKMLSITTLLGNAWWSYGQELRLTLRNRNGVAGL